MAASVLAIISSTGMDLSLMGKFPPLAEIVIWSSVCIPSGLSLC